MRITKGASGFTLIELMIVMAMVAVMMTLAVPGMRQLLANQQLSAAASDLQAAAMQARSTALKFNCRTFVKPLDGTWANGYRIYVQRTIPPVTSPPTEPVCDASGDTTILTQEALPTSVIITKVNGVNNYFAYEGSGFLANDVSGSANATWKITASGTDRVRCLIMERSGRARVHDPRPATTCPTS